VLLLLLLPATPKVMAGYVFAHLSRLGLFVKNFLAPIQVRLLPDFVSRTIVHRGRADYILEGQGQRSRSVGRYALY